MTWFLIALVPPLLYACTNLIDKALLSKYFPEGGVGTLLMFSSLLSIVVLPLLLFIDPSVLEVGQGNIFKLALLAVLDIILIWAYLMALRDAESSATIFYYQLVPVLALILGYFFLNETITQMQLIAMGIIIIGTTIVSFERGGQTLIFRSKTVGFMLLACLCWAVESVFFKDVALQENLWRSLFWKYLALLVIGVGMFTFMPTQRQNFLARFKAGSSSIIALNVLNESLYMSGSIVAAYAFMLAPVALILLTETFQVFFVLMIGVALTFFLPHVFNERLEKGTILQKLIALIITSIGTYLLLS